MKLNCLHLQNLSIDKQLELEKKLLLETDEHWCLINEGTSAFIVMGVSAKVVDFLDLDQVQRLNIPVIKRFSGGGTVVVDQNTICLF